MIPSFFQFSRKSIIYSISLMVSIIYILVSFTANRVFADAYVRMSNGRKVAVAPDGTKIVITSWGEHAVISQSITQNGLTRFAMASDNIQASTNFVGNPTDSSSGNESAALLVGYYIGCQFPQGGTTVNGQFDIDPGEYFLGFYPTPSITATSPASVVGRIYPTNISMIPGTVSVLNVGTPMPLTNGSAIIQYTDIEITAQQAGNAQVPCAGYAQARSFQSVDLNNGNFRLSVTKFGQAFGIG